MKNHDGMPELEVFIYIKSESYIGMVNIECIGTSFQIGRALKVKMVYPSEVVLEFFSFISTSDDIHTKLYQYRSKGKISN